MTTAIVRILSVYGGINSSVATAVAAVVVCAVRFRRQVVGILSVHSTSGAAATAQPNNRGSSSGGMSGADAAAAGVVAVVILLLLLLQREAKGALQGFFIGCIGDRSVRLAGPSAALTETRLDGLLQRLAVRRRVLLLSLHSEPLVSGHMGLAVEGHAEGLVLRSALVH